MYKIMRCTYSAKQKRLSNRGLALKTNHDNDHDVADVKKGNDKTCYEQTIFSSCKNKTRKPRQGSQTQSRLQPARQSPERTLCLVCVLMSTPHCERPRLEVPDGHLHPGGWAADAVDEKGNDKTHCYEETFFIPQRKRAISRKPRLESRRLESPLLQARQLPGRILNH